MIELKSIDVGSSDYFGCNSNILKKIFVTSLNTCVKVVNLTLITI